MNRHLRRVSQANGARLSRGAWTPFERVERPDLCPSREWSAVWANSRYVVFVVPEPSVWGEITRLMIRRHDAEPVHSWTDLQRIKNELCGPERVAIEVYPRESELIDDCNLYHLWVLPTGFDLPLRLHRRRCSHAATIAYEGTIDGEHWHSIDANAVVTKK